MCIRDRYYSYVPVIGQKVNLFHTRDDGTYNTYDIVEDVIVTYDVDNPGSRNNPAEVSVDVLVKDIDFEEFYG